ncbi:DNA polymerase delta catalitic subunit POLD1 [Carpediemonas membranifera]|uniref:DNA polymerase n=1 Tax=Carpediemonas membranifera TaxID=201153 RepID=A0A8J6BAJ2_9EUKA|nr:DNA polymerase delta catalitic subunit POLD1 [Carpediemonas membranifera]|eukprot:KAG9393357.1 DNA polymerase delta catalitic subunit POLD1 [Carpediemonas membranifera]
MSTKRKAPVSTIAPKREVDPEWLSPSSPGGVGSSSGWNRPAVRFDWDSKKDDLIFQQLDIDMSSGYTPNPIGGFKDQIGDIFTFFGVTAEGHSVCLHVHGYYPTLFISAEELIGAPIQLPAVAEHLNNLVRQGTGFSDMPHPVINVCEAQRQSIYTYQGDSKRPFLAITVANQRAMARLRGLLEDGCSLYDMQPEVNGRTTFNSDLDPKVRICVDLGIFGCNWLQAPAGKYVRRTEKQMISCVQIEADIYCGDLISHAPELTPEFDGLALAPVRTLSYDIECTAQPGHFPDANVAGDKVIQIANMVKLQGDEFPFIKTIFVLGRCNSVTGAEVISCETEVELLYRWYKFILAVDPDVITGWNINNFDMFYLLTRAQYLSKSMDTKQDRFDLTKFKYLSRLQNFECVSKDQTFTSKQTGQRDSHWTEMPGRVQFDMMQYVQLNFKLRSYSLNAVSLHFLKEQKEDVHHSQIAKLQELGEDGRRRLAIYCLKDALLPMRVMDKLMALVNSVEMARVMGVPMIYLFLRGQQIKVLSQLYRKAKSLDLVIPHLRSRDDGNKYEGATVLEPMTGFYNHNQPVTTLDFSSLYPSIMIAHNLCYSTLLPQKAVSDESINRVCAAHGLTRDDITITPNRDMFVKATRKPGVLPVVLQEVLEARKKAKADLKVETDPVRRAVLDGRQLALKVSANSVYGFTGAQVGKLPCLQISSSVTSYGRQMIEKTKSVVEAQYPGSQVVYGDTDSVMIMFSQKLLKERLAMHADEEHENPLIWASIQLGKEAAVAVSNVFINPIKLEFEKVYAPYLLISRKRYAGYFWTNNSKPDKLDMKGIESVRRDNSNLVAGVVNRSLQLIMEDNVSEAVEYVKATIRSLMLGELDMAQLVISKQLTRPPEKYDSKQAHTELALKLAKRDPNNAPHVGDRIPYVMTIAGSNAKGYEKAEDPLFVLENDIPIDTTYYLEHQLKKPLERIFEPILKGHVSSLFEGAHTSSVKVASISGGGKKGGLAGFVVRRPQCLGCRADIAEGTNPPLCANCRPRTSEIYQRYLNAFNEAQHREIRLNTECQVCSEHRFQATHCSTTDCLIYYARMKARKDVRKSQEALARMDRPAVVEETD